MPATASSACAMREAAVENDAALIGIVDDDPLFRETLAGNLNDAGYGVCAWESGEDVLAALAEGPRPDLLLLDWKMPGLNGIEVLRRLRATQVAVPVIFLTVLSDQIFEEAALLGGAVDFVEKSRSFTILERRIQLILARGDGADGGVAIARIGALGLDAASRRAQWRGVAVDLTVGEFAMVEALAAKAGRDVSYRELYDAGRGKGFHGGAGEDGYRTNVRASIKRIREKFKAVDPDFEQIGNYPGFGYVWQAGRDA